MSSLVTPRSPVERVRELASGVDALYLSGRAELAPALFEVLEERRQAAEEAGEPVPFPVAGVAFEVEPRSWGKYRYRLVHSCGLVGVTALTTLTEFSPVLLVETPHF